MSRAANTAAVLIAATTVSACSDPKAASEANFRKVLGPAVADSYCQVLIANKLRISDEPNQPAWPLIVSPPMPRTTDSDATERAVLDAGVAAGQLTRTVGMGMAKSDYASGPMTRQAIVSYTPTSRGRERFRSSARGKPPAVANYPTVCAANGEIVKVIRWTDPQPTAFGMTISQVTYQYHGVDIDPSVPVDQHAKIEAPVEAMNVLTLANDGWHLAQ